MQNSELNYAQAMRLTSKFFFPSFFFLNGNMTKTCNLVVVTCHAEHLPIVLPAHHNWHQSYSIYVIWRLVVQILLLKWVFPFYKRTAYP